MRLGPIEKTILSLLGQRSGLDFFITRNEIRKRMNYDPDDIALYNAKRMMEKNPDVDINYYISKIKQHQKIKSGQASFSRALHRLIEKGLVRRFWIISVETGVNVEKMEYGANYDDETGEVFFYLEGSIIDRSIDIPMCRIRKKCCFDITQKGLSELEMRGIAIVKHYML